MIEIRHAAIASLQRVAEERLLAEAHAGLTTIELSAWSVSRAVEIGRQIEPMPADTDADDETWRRRQDTIHTHVQELRDPLIAHDLMRDQLDHEQALSSRTIFARENPTIVALAARQLGIQCAPLACVNGQPATPVKILLRQLVTAGARLRHHGDFDGKGIEIASAIIMGYGAEPWRMGVDCWALCSAHGQALRRNSIRQGCPSIRSSPSPHVNSGSAQTREQAGGFC